MTLWVDTDEQNETKQAMIEEIELLRRELVRKLATLRNHVNYYLYLIKD